MTSSIRAQRPRRSRSPGLALVTAQGGRTRRHKYLHELRLFSLPVLAAMLLQALVYVLVITRTGRNDWDNILVAVAALALVPVASAAILTAFRRHEAPIVSSTLVAAVLFSVAVSLLSAVRVPVSYVGLALCLPVVVAIMAYANIRFHRSASARVALAPFPRAEAALALLGGEVPVLAGPEADLAEIDLLLIDPYAHHRPEWSGLLAQCYLGGIDILPWTRYLEIRQGRVDVSSFEIFHIAYSPSQLLYARLKRGLDLLAVLLTLPLTVPLALLVGLYIFARDGGPVIFVQVRRGFGGRRFRLYKFRTMRRGSAGGATEEADRRIIPGCRLIRRLRLDELPQLVNVVRGEMSLIGPRPVAEDIARASERAEPKYALRALVLPGLTGWAQVTAGYAGTTEQEIEKLSYDLYYIKHLSFDLDVLVLVKTLRTVLFGIGAR